MRNPVQTNWASVAAGLLLCWLASPGQAEDYSFYWANPLPQGNALYSLAFEDGQTGLAVGDRGTVLRTTDRGQTWNDQTDFVEFSSTSSASDPPPSRPSENGATWSAPTITV